MADMEPQDWAELFLGTLATLALIGGMVAARIPETGFVMDDSFAAGLGTLIVLFFGYKVSDLAGSGFVPGVPDALTGNDPDVSPNERSRQIREEKDRYRELRENERTPGRYRQGR